MDTHSLPDQEAQWTAPLGPRVSVRYDAVGDILYLESCRPYGEQDSAMTEGESVIRWNAQSGAVERVEIMFFSRRPADDPDLRALPLDATVRGLLVALLGYAQAA